MGAVEMSNLEVKTLLEAWGFVAEGGNGGHLMMRHDPSGKKVQITAPGRSTPTPYRAITKAARIVDVTVHDFKLGPAKKKKKARPAAAQQIDLDKLDEELQAIQAQVAEEEPLDDEFEDHCASEPWLDEDLGPSDRIVEYLRCHAGQPVSKNLIITKTGLSDTQVGAALSYITKHRKEVVRPKRGYYSYDDSEERRRQEETERLAELARREEEERKNSSFTKIGQDCHGRAVLMGPRGEVWIAIPAEPGFHAFRQTTT